jgi:signal transduction histidine kinase
VNHKTRLKQLLMSSIILWVVSLAMIGYLTYSKFTTALWLIMLVVIIGSAVLSLLAINQSQLQLAEANKSHSRTKRQVQESQLKIDRFEYDSKKSGELRRIVINSTQEKDHSLRNMADALDHAMDEIVEITEGNSDETLSQIRTRAEGMKRYAGDLKSLAQLELKSEPPAFEELDFLSELNRMMDQWSTLGKSRKIKIKLDNPEDQMPLVSDINWIENLLGRVVQALIRMNKDTVLHVHIIGYMDAEIGDALRIEFSIDGRQLDEKQLQHLMTEYVSIVEEGQEVGPGLAFVVGRRMAQMLNGSIDVENSQYGIEVLVILPRSPRFAEELEEASFT